MISWQGEALITPLLHHLGESFDVAKLKNKKKYF
jgi:hypothetical protein